jgi:hypothetical protein
MSSELTDHAAIREDAWIPMPDDGELAVAMNVALPLVARGLG